MLHVVSRVAALLGAVAICFGMTVTAAASGQGCANGGAHTDQFGHQLFEMVCNGDCPVPDVCVPLGGPTGVPGQTSFQCYCDPTPGQPGDEYFFIGDALCEFQYVRTVSGGTVTEAFHCYKLLCPEVCIDQVVTGGFGRPADASCICQ